MGAGGTVYASPILKLTPSPDLVGSPGSVKGWGFTLTNDFGFIEITAAQFCVNPACTPSTLGTFIDFISVFNDIIVGDASAPDMGTESEPFDALAKTGIGSFAISTTAAGTDIGQIILTYNLTDLDPSDPNAVTLDTGLTVSANASVSTTGTPEPGTAGLIFLPVALLAFGRIYRKFRS